MKTTTRTTALLLAIVATTLIAVGALAATNSTNGTTPNPPATGLPAIVMAIVGGAVSGLIYAGLSYAVSHAADEDFDAYKFVQPLVMGAFIGGLSGYLGLDYASTQAFVHNAGYDVALVTIVDKGAKAIIRHLPQKADPAPATDAPAPKDTGEGDGDSKT